MAQDFRADQIRTNKIISSGSTGTNAKLLFYPFTAASNLSGGINSSLFSTSNIGSDIYAYFSGSIRSIGTANSFGATVFGGDVAVSGAVKFLSPITSSATAQFLTGIVGGLVVTGTMVASGNLIASGTFVASGVATFVSGLSGSLTALKDGTQYIRGVGAITVTTGATGQISIGVTGALGRLIVGSYNTTATALSSSPQVCGQNYWNPTEQGFVSGVNGVIFRAIVSTITASNSAAIRLFNLSTLEYVEIGGTGVTQLTTTSTASVRLESVNLANNVVGFRTGSSDIYETQLYTGASPLAVTLGMAELLTT